MNTIGEKIYYFFERNNRKTIGITIKSNGDIFVKAPLKAPISSVLDFIEKKAKWIYTNHIKLKSKHPTEVFQEGEQLQVLGKKYTIELKKYNKKTVNLELLDNKMIISIPFSSDEKEKLIEKAYNNLIIKIANEIIPQEMNKMCTIVGLKPNQLKIRNFKRAWGNCSNKKIISINKDLCKYSYNAIDYVCLHEICHLKHMNHSKNFWNMVANYMPNYKEIQKELK